MSSSQGPEIREPGCLTASAASIIPAVWLSRPIVGPVYSPLPWQFLYFLPDPQGQGSLRPTFFSTCTGMGFDPAFYYYRPVSAYAAHGYGPVVFAGAEVIRLLENTYPRLNDSAVQFYDTDMSDKGAIFAVE